MPPLMVVSRLPPNSSVEGRDYYFCQPQERNLQQSCRNLTDRGVTLVIGSLRLLGSVAASYLSSSGVDVEAVADVLDILDHREVWYREEILREYFNVTVKLLNLTSKDAIERMLIHRESSPSRIVFIFPSLALVMEGRFGGGESFDLTMSRAVAQLVTVLKVVKTLSLCTQVILVSQTQQHYTRKGTSNHSASNGWISLLEMLSVYGQMSGIPVTLLQTNSLAGFCDALLPENHLKQFSSSPLTGGCLYIDKIMNVLINTTRNMNDCQLIEVASAGNRVLDTDEVNLAVLQAWAAEYSRRQRNRASDKKLRDVVFTSYFTSVKDPQRPVHRSSSQFCYMEDYYTSLKRLGLKTVIFHDGLDSGFQQRISSDYDKIMFDKVDSLRNRTTNDARFYAYYKYLLEHSSIARVLLTDISDVVFQRNPFELMSLLGDHVFIGTDVDTIPNIFSEPNLREKLALCSGGLSIGLMIEKDAYYNAGIVAGQRERILSVLALMIAYMDQASSEENCNTPALNYVAHRYFFQDVFTGFPLQSRFRRRQSYPKGVYLVHK